jgi:PadR family transcriptional regulator, regulatory protein AphA
MSSPPQDARSPRLGPVSYAVLGLIGLRGPSTPYELKKALARTIANFWPFPHTQLYTETERLERLGLLDVHEELEGRRRKTYSLTPAGSRTLQTWMAHPTRETLELHDMALMQLFFSEFATTEELVELARTQVEQYEARLRTYAEIADVQRDRARPPRRMAPLEVGVRMSEVFRDFWRGIAENPPGDRAATEEAPGA